MDSSFLIVHDWLFVNLIERDQSAMDQFSDMLKSNLVPIPEENNISPG